MSSSQQNGERDLRNFSKVLDDELDLIKKQLGENQGRDKSKENLTGLAFSGGGIRSATFNLGVIQSLAKNGLLSKFDYLSTVSGGGYIGSWLSAQLHRSAGNSSQEKINNFQNAIKDGEESGQELDSVTWLRSYSNYLTPKKGLSGDTLSAIGTWLRNTLLNQAMLGLFFALIILLPQLILQSVNGHDWLEAQNINYWFTIGALCIYAATFLTAVSLPKLQCCAQKNISGSSKKSNGPIILIIFLSLAASWFLSLGMSSASFYTNLAEVQPIINIIHESSWGNAALNAASYSPPFAVVAFLAVAYTLPWLAAAILHLANAALKNCAQCHHECFSLFKKCTNVGEREDSSPVLFAIGVTITAPIAGAFGGWLMYCLSKVIASQGEEFRHWWASGFGTPLLLLIFCLTVVLHQGLMARLFRVSQLEWWARLGGYVLYVAAIWAGIHALLIYAPALINRLDYEYVTAGGLAWLIHSLAGVLLGKGAGTGGKNSIPWKEWTARAAPYIFVLGILIIVSWGVHTLMLRSPQPEICQRISEMKLNHAAPSPSFSQHVNCAVAIKDRADTGMLWLFFAGGLFVLLVLSWRVDVNLFSIHHFYRNRLTRCYLGAGRTNRQQHPFTGFDPCDDIKLANLKQRPLHLINTALNLVSGKELAWQDRKAASFTFSPLACGSEYPPNAINPNGGYYSSERYMGGVRLGTAMAASGAAASPSMGYHSSPAVAFLLTVFNVRLGHWCPNPDPLHTDNRGIVQTIKRHSIKRESPVFGGWYLLKELFSLSDDKDIFVYLSDGGHFENLGVYELVRRRCRHIMVIDAGQDEKRTFEDAANMIRRCYIDFGVTININLDELRADKDGNSPSCYALGDITYPTPAGDKNAKESGSRGVLLYVKPSLLKDIPEDIRQYAKTDEDFPHQTTGDQFFDEAQFESYRHLGNFLMDEVLRTVSQKKTPRGKSWDWMSA